MHILEQRIIDEGVVASGDILKVGSFLNQKVDVPFIYELAKEFYSLYKNCGVNKILTIEASGISAATLTAYCFGIPMVVAKKSQSQNIHGDIYSAIVYSYTHNVTSDVIVSKSYLNENDHILIIDDFLAKGAALKGLISIVEQANATLVGCGILIEKAYQGGGNELRQKGVRIESLAKIKNLYGVNGIEFE